MPPGCHRHQRRPRSRGVRLGPRRRRQPAGTLHARLLCTTWLGLIACRVLSVPPILVSGVFSSGLVMPPPLSLSLSLSWVPLSLCDCLCCAWMLSVGVCLSALLALIVINVSSLASPSSFLLSRAPRLSPLSVIHPPVTRCCPSAFGSICRPTWAAPWFTRVNPPLDVPMLPSGAPPGGRRQRVGRAPPFPELIAPPRQGQSSLQCSQHRVTTVLPALRGGGATLRRVRPALGRCALGGCVWRSEAAAAAAVLAAARAGTTLASSPCTSAALGHRHWGPGDGLAWSRHIQATEASTEPNQKHRTPQASASGH